MILPQPSAFGFQLSQIAVAVFVCGAGLHSGPAMQPVTHAAEPLLIGVAEADITPAAGFPMAGYYHERLAEGTIDPLKAKALVLRQGEVSAAMVACDLTGISRDLCEAVRTRASQRTGIPAALIAVTATHSHTAPDYSKHLYQYLASPEAKSASADNPPYAQKLIEGIVQAIVDADADKQASGVAVGAATQNVPVSFNRRFVMKDGSTQTWRSLNDPQVLRAAGPIDPEMAVVTVSDTSGKVRGVLSNFALHLDTVGGSRWSADYPFFIEQQLRKRLGPEVISLFGTGCCGDINHADPSRSERNRTDFIGNALAATVEAALPELRPAASQRLQVTSSVVHLPLQEISQAEIDRSRQLLELIRSGGKVDFLDQVTAYKTLIMTQFRKSTQVPDAEQMLSWGLSHAWSGVGDALPVDVQTISIGQDVAIVFLPGEVFVDLGLAIKRGSPFPITLVVELSNAVETAYIPTRAACVGGSYEVTNSTVQPGAGELLVEAALRQLRQAAAEAVAANAPAE
jgi:neutral ceramidase